MEEKIIVSMFKEQEVRDPTDVLRCNGKYIKFMGYVNAIFVAKNFILYFSFSYFMFIISLF